MDGIAKSETITANGPCSSQAFNADSPESAVVMSYFLPIVSLKPSRIEDSSSTNNILLVNGLRIIKNSGYSKLNCQQATY